LMAKSNAAAGRKLKEVILIPDICVDSLTETALMHVWQVTSRSLGVDCRLRLVSATRADFASTTLMVVTTVRAIIAVYETSDYASSVRCNRVCDAIVLDWLSYHGAPAGLPSTLQPLPGNGFGGSRVLPSGAKADLMSWKAKVVEPQGVHRLSKMQGAAAA